MNKSWIILQVEHTRQTWGKYPPGVDHFIYVHCHLYSWSWLENKSGCLVYMVNYIQLLNLTEAAYIMDVSILDEMFLRTVLPFWQKKIEEQITDYTN